MIIVAQAPLFLVLLFLVGMVLAAAEDLWRRRVSNIAVAIVGLSGIAAFVMTGHAMRLWEPLLVALAVLVIGSFLFARGLMGGGDVKLMAAGTLWYVLKGELIYLAAVLLAGGALALVVLVTRWIRRRLSTKGLGKTSIGIPYAVAIAGGALWTLFEYRFR